MLCSYFIYILICILYIYIYITYIYMYVYMYIYALYIHILYICLHRYRHYIILLIVRRNYIFTSAYEKKRASPQIPSWNGFPNARKDATIVVCTEL